MIQHYSFNCHASQLVKSIGDSCNCISLPCDLKWLHPFFFFFFYFFSIQAMESKLLVGGKNIVDHTNEQQRMLELKRQEIAEQVYQTFHTQEPYS